ncbi:MAG TPA: hypothetical protein VFZ99_00655 [Terriglobales bacterium]
MADALPNNEVPNFDTYPAPGPSGAEELSASSASRTYMPGTSGSTGAVAAYKELPGERSALEERAAQVGGAVGRAVVTVRRGRGKLIVMKSRARQAATGNLAQRAGDLNQSARELAGNAQRRASEFAHEAQVRASELLEDAQERFSGLAGDLREHAADWKNRADYRAAQLRSSATEARRKAQAYVEENPFQALAIVGGSAVALGAALRIVRSRNAQ